MQRSALDQLLVAHQLMGGNGPGRRHLTQQVNFAYLVLVASHFQRYCRSLHSEAVDFLVAETQDASTSLIFQSLLTEGRKLDHGNANASTLGSDFGRMGLSLWDVLGSGAQMKRRKKWLDRLNVWRNKIAHQDFNYSSSELDLVKKIQTPKLREVRAARTACEWLARGLDKVVGDHVAAVAGKSPW